jgi:hypothetical protein
LYVGRVIRNIVDKQETGSTAAGAPPMPIDPCRMR